jgi:hypothetical protein
VSNELIIDESHGGAVAIAEQPERTAANDLRHAMMTLPVEHQNMFLAQYKERRDNFRQWLMAQLIEGCHYGVPPGCEPKTKEINGVIHFGVWSKKANNYEWYPPTQWQHKPSLYAAGADFICDIMGVRDEYATDMVGWQQMGSKAGNAVVKCQLKSRATGELIGESLGAYYHQYDPNNALKMAGKCAKVGAVINAFDLRDLFTQEEPKAAPHENPMQDDAAPAAPTRAKREKPQTEVSEAQLGHVTAEWKSRNPEPSGNLMNQRAKFSAWVREVTRREFNPAKMPDWKQSDYIACCSALGMPTLEEIGK